MRTVYDVQKTIKAFYKENGRRPFCTDTGMKALDVWLRGRGKSIPMLCEQMSIPAQPPRKINHLRTLDSTQQDVQDYYDKHGTRPNSRVMPVEDSWLRKTHASSVHLVANALGLPGGPRLRRTLEDVREAVHVFYFANDRRPLGVDLPKESKCLRTIHKTTLRSLCDDMLLPPHPRNHSVESISAAAEDFLQEHNYRPTAKDMTREHRWLEKKGLSLSKICDGLSMPVAKRGRHAPSRAPRKTQEGTNVLVSA